LREVGLHNPSGKVFAVSTETHEIQENEPPKVSDSVLTGIAMIGGLGIILMIGAAGVGVVLSDAPSDIIGLVVAIGASLLVTSIAGWMLAVRPHEHFDDINVPKYHGHHDHEHNTHVADAVEQPGEVNVVEPVRKVDTH
jgi:hypothetical protein